MRTILARLALVSLTLPTLLGAQVTFAGTTSPFVGKRSAAKAAFRGRNFTDQAANQNFFWGKGNLGTRGNRKQVQANASDWVRRFVDYRVEFDATNRWMTLSFPDGDFNLTGGITGSFGDSQYLGGNAFRVTNVGNFTAFLADVAGSRPNRTGCGGAARLVSVTVDGDNLLPEVLDTECRGATTAGAWFLASSTESWTADVRVEFDAGYGANDSQRFEFATFDGKVVPEPSTWVLMASGMIGVAGFARRRRQAR